MTRQPFRVWDEGGGEGETLTERVRNLERAIHGTPENDYRDGLTNRVSGIQASLDRIGRWLNRWGFMILGGMFATGLVNGSAAKTIGGFLAGVAKTLGSP